VWLNGTRVLTQTYNVANQVDGWTYDAAGNLTDDGTATYTYTYTGDGVLIDDRTTHYTQDRSPTLDACHP
jgi:hypothetical protein